MKIRIRITWGSPAKPEPAPAQESIASIVGRAKEDVVAPVMEAAQSAEAAIPRDELDETAQASAPAYLWWMAFASTLANLGGHLDIAWHRSIGTDVVWTIPHALIYLTALCAALGCVYLIAMGTFFRARIQRGETIRLWGLRGPYGAFIAAWGVAAMIASAPMDHWWHAAYGLDSRIMIPPHALLLVGMLAIQGGTLVLITARINRNNGASDGAIGFLQLYTGAMMLVLVMMTISEPIARPFLHSAVAYRVIGLVAPALLVAVAISTNRKWAATTTSAIYSVFCMLLLWLLPLFSVEPKAGPVLSEVHHLVPLEFPILLIIPAILVDLLLLKLHALNRFILSFIIGPVFFAALLIAEWNIAGFLQSPQSENWFFGTHYFGIESGPQSLYVLHKFFGEDQDPALKLQMAIAFGFTLVSAWFGLICGDWLRRTRR